MLLTTFLFSGCASSGPSTPAHYVQQNSNMIIFPKKSAVLVISNDDLLKLSVETELMNRGVIVKDLDIFKEYYLNTYAGRYVKDAQQETNVPDYNGAETIASAIKNGEVSGSKDFLRDIKTWNDLKDELIRVEDYGKLELKKRDVLHSLYKENNISTIIFLEKKSDKRSLTFVTRVVKSQNEELAFTMYYQVDVEAIKQRRNYEPNPSTLFDRDSETDMQVINSGYARKLVNKMLGSR